MWNINYIGTGKTKTTHSLIKLMKDLQKRQQILINLITRVGGKNNVQKWTDELLQIDWKLAEIEVNKMVYTYKGYSIIQSGDDAGLHFNGKKINSNFVSIYSIDGFVELLDEYALNWATRLQAEGKDPVKPNLKPTEDELASYANKKAYQQSLEASFLNDEWKLFWREEFIAQTGIETEYIPVYKHTAGKFPERYNTEKLQITDKENADRWLKEIITLREIEALNNHRFNLFVDHHFFGGIFAAAKDEYSYSTWCAMEDVINENDYYSTKPEVVKAKAYLAKYKEQGKADSRAEFELQQAACDATLERNYEVVITTLLSIPGMKPEYLEERRFGVYLLGGDRGKNYGYADYRDSDRYCYNHVDLWHETHEPEDVKAVTREMLANASYYYEARQQDKFKDKYEAYKKAQGNKPVKPFQKWLKTVA